MWSGRGTPLGDSGADDDDGGGVVAGAVVVGAVEELAAFDGGLEWCPAEDPQPASTVASAARVSSRVVRT
jgi:hypothetical protein